MNFKVALPKILNNERGETSLEAAITLFPFLLLILGLFQFTMIAFTSLSLQYSLHRAARSTILRGLSADAIKLEVRNQAQKLGIDVSDLVVRVCSEANPSCAGNDAGGSGQYVLLAAEKPAVFPVLGRMMGARARLLIKNEPF